jgi:hypothetical protein
MMTQTKTHEALVGGQFGARAAAYLGSAVHAQGADLQALANLVQGQAHAQSEPDIAPTPDNVGL